MAGTFPGYALLGIVLGVVVLLIVGFNIVSMLRKKPEPVADVEAVVPAPGKPTAHPSRSQETLPSYQTAMDGNERLPDGIVLSDK
ncbi:unnamed protein product [Rhizoctonia solani]|uniref:Uncharacterized protein n=1 Tax=Rhizoctonia solani TaxID=456999 RepID=A0A8H3D7M0_9AGAM|nr:unnamed protein product [Rhizoctonia solani]